MLLTKSTSLVNLSFLVLLFFARGSSSNVCKLNVKLKQILHNEGFHRNITYSIVFHNEEKDENLLTFDDCIVGIDQTLPVGVFANPDELADFRRLLKLHAIPKSQVNVELPAEYAQESSIYILEKAEHNRAFLWLPVHARYHQAVSGGGSARNEIVAPKLYLQCPDGRLDKCEKALPTAVTFFCSVNSKDKCKWKEIPYALLTETLTWTVPVGNTDHFTWTAVGTALVVVVGSLYLLNTLHQYKRNAGKKKR